MAVGLIDERLPPPPSPVKRRAAMLSIGSNTLLILMKVVAGAVTGSVALLKARAAAAATGRVAVADDSGIEAAALDGRPGVRSARYAGEHATDEENLAKLLREAPAESPLAYVCAMAYVDPHAPVEHVVEARCTGTLAAEPRGDGGFGYDPAFVPDDRDDGRTMAELTQEEKDTISHRGRAARELVAWLSG